MSEQDRLVAGRYRLRERIGGGGMGAVWLARDERLGRDVAVKQVLPPSGADDPALREQRERAMREGRIAARLSHPHAISVYDVALEDDQPWLVMEYLPSRSLSAVLAEDGVLRVDQVAQIGAQVADALAATHEAGIVHRDVKPGNILIGQGGRVEGLVKITDFGISHASGDVTLTQTGQITGTPAYLAPEAAQGIDPGPSGDVFSLAATLYTCLEGEPPFGMAENSLQQLYRVAAGEINPPRRSGALTGPLLRMLSVDPTARPSMTEVRDELAALAAGRDGDTTTVLTARTDVASAGRNQTSRLAAGGAAPAAAAAAAAQPSPTPPPARAPARAPEPAPRPTAPPRSAGPAASSAPRRERRVPRTAWLAAAVVAALVGLAVFWSVALNDPDGGTTAQETPGASSPADPTAADPDGTEPAADPTGEDGGGGDAPAEDPATDAAGGVIEADTAEDYLDQYHDLVVSDPDAAYEQAGPTLRGAIDLAGFREFWGRFDEVSISDVQVEEGGDTAVADMELVFPDGTRQVERHRFTFVEQDGRLVLDRDDFLEVTQGRS